MFLNLCIFAVIKRIKMCTYHIALDNSLVMQAETAFQIKEPFQVWLQQQVERWLLAQVNGKSQSQSKHSRLSDEELKEKLSAYPPLEESCFPSLAAEDYGTYLKSRSGQLPKGLEKWL